MLVPLFLGARGYCLPNACHTSRHESFVTGPYLRERRIEGRSVRLYLYETSAEGAPVGSKVVKLDRRRTISWRHLLSLTLVNDELPFEMRHEFEVFLLLVCPHNLQLLSK
jgi:hypothetical protein